MYEVMQKKEINEKDTKKASNRPAPQYEYPSVNEYGTTSILHKPFSSSIFFSGTSDRSASHKENFQLVTKMHIIHRDLMNTKF